ncbi:MAG: hypothetical protein K0R54_13 [Clostridiaceae bacterium]|jgi:hypothetical protein|nr:hypothetical protein [Clostridiaceae bacterium]
MNNAKDFKILICAILSRVINESFKTIGNIIIFLTILSLIIYKILSYSNIELNGIWTFFISLIIILSFSTIRVSNNFIFSHITKHVSMIIKDTDRYRNYDYFKENKEISELLKNEFIDGLVNLSHHSRIVRFSTHGWFIKNVLTNSIISEIYDISIKENRTTKIFLEIFALIKLEDIKNLTDEQLDIIFRKRKAYKVVLKKKRLKYL